MLSDLSVTAIFPAFLPQLLRSGLDRFANANVGAAAADVPTHRLLDIGIRRFRRLLEQGDRAHDLSALTIPALHDVLVNPCLLYCATYAVVFEALDGDDGP